jgi:SAM-dependent methyltransferase
MEHFVNTMKNLLYGDKKINGQVFSRYESRGKFEYDLFLFPENPIEGLGIVGRAIGDLSRELKGWGEPQYRHYVLEAKDVGDFSVVSGSEVNKMYGAQKGMFKDRAVILDLGSGAGKAKHEYQWWHPKNMVIGLDPYNGSENPGYPGEQNFIAGMMEKLPFKNDTFDGILACETFPRHVNEQDELELIIREITRVCKEGAIFRGTHIYGSTLSVKGEDGFMHSTEVNKMEVVIPAFVNNGWEITHTNTQITARLVKKTT